MALKILVTNDDGINAEGLKILVKNALKYGEVTVVAPLVEQSGKSHSIEIRKSLTVEETSLFPNVKSYSVSSSPADCVRCAKYGLNLDFDIVFSGINKGYNLGEDILYSGTVGAASEAVMMNKKAIAFSSKRDSFKGIEEHFDEIMEYILANKLLEKGSLYNVNVPLDVKGIKITKQGATHFNTVFEGNTNEYYQRGRNHFELEDDLETDVYAICSDYISITPLTVDRTDRALFGLLKNNK